MTTHQKHNDVTPPPSSASFKLDIRAFIPFQEIGGFHGDDRGFSTDREASSRIHYSVLLRPSAGDYLNSEAWPGKSVGPIMAVGPKNTGYSLTHEDIKAEQIDHGTRYNIHIEGGNPLVPGFPPIDANVSIAITRPMPGVVQIEGQLKGAGFPALETVLTDKGQRPIFLAGFMPSSNGVSNVISLARDAQRTVGTFKIVAGVNNDGSIGRVITANFTSPTTSVGNARDSGTYTAEGWSRVVMGAATPDNMPHPHLPERNRAAEQEGNKNTHKNQNTTENNKDQNKSPEKHDRGGLTQ